MWQIDHLTIILIWTLVCIVSPTHSKTCNLPAKGSKFFPANFSFGAATSAYQIEGAWKEDGKSPSIWDEFTHDHPDKIKDGTNGDIAADSYHRFEQDLHVLKELKVDHYRFSISWTRIFPSGEKSSKNQKGIDYYNNIIDQLLANGIEPMVTMFHFDLPTKIQEVGGFTNPVLIEYFVSYAIELFKNYGDRVKTWITINEPLLFCSNSYGTGIYPPQIMDSGVSDYLCIDTCIKAHAATYRAYKSMFYEKQRGKVGITVNSPFFFSKSNDAEIVRRGVEFHLGLQIHPIFGKSGDFPEILIRDIGKNSQEEGRNSSRLPNLDEDWKTIIRGSADFLGLNHYSSRFLEPGLSDLNVPNPSWKRDYNFDDSTVDPEWMRAESRWLYCVPEGLEGLLKYIRDEYDNVEVKITENGWSDNGGIEDINRVLFLKSYLQAVLNAINDGCNISSYTHWSLLDNFEWLFGYADKFGLYAVNMSSPNKERIPKKSAAFYRRVIETRKIPLK